MERPMSTATLPSLTAIVSVDPETLGGVPVFKGTRVPLRSLFDHLKAGDSLDLFLDDFPGVTKEQAQAAIALAEAGLLRSLSAP
jgi:uncharacterized protein (DUF433 family)